ncbi:uncharacterized protein [Halyomorpha halys]|uniref:uncharacterized protein isoform X2 n=1 Tax=Halyomorpha halys TaxID=286706 RepID=UPI0006D4F5D5|nr:uncharacterized protein LOC106691335 isoform X1 [Halyomorpha halys]
MDSDNSEKNSKKQIAVVPPFSNKTNEEAVSDTNNSEEFDESGQSDDGSEEAGAPALLILKNCLRDDHRQEIRTFHEISNLTRSLANTFQNEKKNRILAHNLNHELRLRRTIDYHVRLLANSSQSCSDITTALNEVHDREHLFDEQFNFINESVSYGQMDVLYPNQLLDMSFERQRLLFKHILKNNYPTHSSLHMNPRLFSESGTESMDLQEFSGFNDRSDDSSDSDDEQLPSPVQVQKEVAPKGATVVQTSQGAGAEIPSTMLEAGAEISSTTLEAGAEIPSISQEAGTEISNSGITTDVSDTDVDHNAHTGQQVGAENVKDKTEDTAHLVEDIAMEDNDEINTVTQSSQEPISQLNDGEHSQDKRGDTTQLENICIEKIFQLVEEIAHDNTVNQSSMGQILQQNDGELLQNRTGDTGQFSGDIAMQDSHCIINPASQSLEQLLQQYNELSQGGTIDPAQFPENICIEETFHLEQENIAVEDTHGVNAASQTSPELLQLDDGELSQDGTRDTALFPVFDIPLSSPGCSRWSRPRAS